MLEDLKIVEYATYIAAPGAAGVMADWGASVIKIEPLGGDPIRKFFDSIGLDIPVNPVFEFDNRAKRSIALDISKPEGRDVAVALTRNADIFLTNSRPGALKRARLDYESLRTENPRLIYASVTGYGLDGPDADKPGFDIAAFWARSGVAALTTPKDVEPFPLRTGFGDHVCSLATIAAILAAVHERARTGIGRLVETSLLRTGVYALGSDFAIQMRLGKIGSTRARREAIAPLVNFFRTKDGRWLTLLPRQGAPDWPNIARAAGKPELLDDARFSSARLRRENGAALVDALDAAFAGLDFAIVAQRLDSEDVAWAPVQAPRDVLKDAQVIAAGCFVETPDGAGGAFAAPAGPARFHGADDGPRGPSPSLGQHTDKILGECGYGVAQIAALRQNGVIG